jgi:hypothetical protein
MLNNMLSKNIPNTIWRTRNDKKTLNSCCTCRGERFTAKVTEGLDGYSYRVQSNNIVYRDKVNTIDDLISDISMLFNTLDNE